MGMAASSSKDKGRARDGEVDWSATRCFLPPWHEQPKCKCHCSCIIDVCEFNGTDRAGRHYFKCVDLDPDFMV
jgi:hypothetical protein